MGGGKKKALRLFPERVGGWQRKDAKKVSHHAEIGAPFLGLHRYTQSLSRLGLHTLCSRRRLKSKASPHGEGARRSSSPRPEDDHQWHFFYFENRFFLSGAMNDPPARGLRTNRRRMARDVGKSSCILSVTTRFAGTSARILPGEIDMDL